MNDKVKEAVETLKDFCKMRNTCDGCYFFDNGNDCCVFMFNEIPCDWEFGGAE